MRPKSVPEKEPATEVVKKIRRATRRHFSAEDTVYSHPAIVGYAASWPIRNANLVKAMLIATRASAGARKRRSTRPSRTPFQHPIRFQSSSRRRAGAPIVPDPFHGGWRGRCLYEPRRLHVLLQEPHDRAPQTQGGQR